MGGLSRLVILALLVGSTASCGSTVYSPGMPEVDGGSSASGSSGAAGASGAPVSSSGSLPSQSDGSSGGSSGLSSGTTPGPGETAVDVIVQAIGGPVSPTSAMKLAGIGVDATHVYVMAVENPNPATFTSYVVKTPKSGSPSTAIYSTTQGYAVSLATDSTSAYFQNAGAVSVVPLDGGPATTVHNSQCQSGLVALNSNRVFWTCPGEQLWSRTKAVGPVGAVTGTSGPLYGLAADGDRVYVATYTSISTMPVAGGTVTELVSLPGTTPGLEPVGLAVDDSRLYWIQGSNIHAVAKTGGSVQTIVTLTNANPNRPNKSLAVDATHVWWTTSSRIVRAPK